MFGFVECSILFVTQQWSTTAGKRPKNINQYRKKDQNIIDTLDTKLSQLKYLARFQFRNKPHKETEKQPNKITSKNNNHYFLLKEKHFRSVTETDKSITTDLKCFQG